MSFIFKCHFAWDFHVENIFFVSKESKFFIFSSWEMSDKLWSNLFSFSCKLNFIDFFEGMKKFLTFVGSWSLIWNWEFLLGMFSFRINSRTEVLLHFLIYDTFLNSRKFIRFIYASKNLIMFCILMNFNPAIRPHYCIGIKICIWSWNIHKGCW